MKANKEKRKQVKYVRTCAATVDAQVQNAMHKKGYVPCGSRMRTVSRGNKSVDVKELRFEKKIMASYCDTKEKIADIAEIKAEKTRDFKAEIHVIGG